MTQIKKDVKYINRDFNSLKQSLIDFTKNYYPSTFNDFSEASIGMMFLELSAYVGDVLSYYTDIQLRESLASTAGERINIINIAQSRGYKPKNIVPAITVLDVFQLVPSIQSGSVYIPDWNYAVTIDANMLVQSSVNNINFRTLNIVDFKHSSSLDTTNVSVYQVDNNNNPVYFLLKKQSTAVAGTVNSVSYTFNEPKRYDKIVLPETNIIEILDIFDSDNNQWYEVPYMAQDVVFNGEINTMYNSSYYNSSSIAPFILKPIRTSRRFVTRINSDNSYTLQFGSGISSVNDAELVPNPDLVGNSLYPSTVSYSIDPSNFLYTKSYGLAPANTTLTIRYTTGGGLISNVASNTINKIISANISTAQTNLNSALYNFVQSSIACNNPNAATGGSDGDSIEEIREATLASYASQNRAINASDYVARVYSMPKKFGTVSKVHVCKNVNDNFSIDLYVLGLDQNKNLTNLNEIVKLNLKTYLNEYRMLTDGINIKDAYIVNIGIDFQIMTLPGYNSNEVLLRCIDKLRSIFDISKWQINQPIILSNLYTELDKVTGVQTVVNINIKNLYDTLSGYSGNVYNIQLATKNGVIYPSYDPCIFEVKYVNNDIQGKVLAN